MTQIGANLAHRGNAGSSEVALLFAGQSVPRFARLRELVARRADLKEWLCALCDDDELVHVMLEGRPSSAADSRLQQPAMVVAAAVFYRELEERVGSRLDACIHAGPSLGELSAAAGAGALDWEDAIALARARARFMQDADAGRGAMGAVFAVSAEWLEDLCRRSAGTVVLANEVSCGQTLISGEAGAVGEVIAECSRVSGKRALSLPISVAAHSPLMSRAQERFASLLEHTSIRAPERRLRSSLDLEEIETADGVRSNLVRQLTERVHWRQLMAALVEEGIDRFLGVGLAEPLLQQLARDHRDLRIGNCERFRGFGSQAATEN